MKILLTGGCGYIGSHTAVDLLEKGFEVIIVDNLSRSSASVLDGIEEITGKKPVFYQTDLCDREATEKIFAENKDIQGIIHFAAYKSVGESVRNPLLYYHNNIASLVNMLENVEKYAIPYFVFSSSCSVYGNIANLPVTEQSPMAPAESPYGFTKQIGEQMIQDFARKYAKAKFVLLRYFNPVGAHPSAKIGETPFSTPENLVPYITQTAAGKREQLTIHGNDYPTRDGTCIRDYIHVSDIASAHTLALQYLMATPAAETVEIYNLGTGNGVSVLEMVEAFEEVSSLKLPYTIGARRAGDVIAVYADNTLAKTRLGWKLRYDVHDMMRTAWAWERKN
ncbi:MAG: UDP-glucose 4-epimerase GalE [Chitinophagales bacterium]|nr:UDP-glucose 4-epimerase GalE [Bacteroidota bacterium]MCB9042744.1 UDP-glucose 4-epimerase GalE [Chitinophagales bacterium]